MLVSTEYSRRSRRIHSGKAFYAAGLLSGSRELLYLFWNCCKSLMKKLLTLLLVIGCISAAGNDRELDSLLIQLDQVISMKKQYAELKEERIDKIVLKLQNTRDLLEKARICGELCAE
jgi:hypothetical protein